MKKFFFFLLISSLAIDATAQKMFTKNGKISFFSKTDMEDISAVNNQVMSVLNTQTGELQFSVLIKSFKFEKALMEEHFNENYLESNKFPKASFKGAIDDKSKVDFGRDGAYKVTISGDLMIHGVTKKVTTVPGTITIKEGKPTGTSVFKVKLADYEVNVPSVVKKNISETIDINVSCVYDQKM